MSRRAVLSVPASEPRKIAKALAAQVDEVVVDLEDAVSVNEKDAARENVRTLAARCAGLLAVRVNALGTPWADDDVAACVSNPHVDSIVVPKCEDPAAVADLVRRLDQLESAAGRRRPLLLQALIESPLGIQHVAQVAAATERMAALIIGYADLSASVGRRIDASWQFAQDAVLLAARVTGIQAIDGPLLTVAADEALEKAAACAEAMGFDGKWVIHPAQVATVQRAFDPSTEEVAEAREILAVLHSSSMEGRGALQWRGRMLDEAVAARARRTLDRTVGS
jgi:citrate lyase subunit beta/citryl-CoA lyase